jgi:transcription antitermination factor NusG
MSNCGTIDGKEHASDARQWFALSVNTKLTWPILIALENKGFESFTPFQTTVRKVRDRISEMVVPAFPGYIFVRLDLRFRLPALMTPGVRRIIGYGGQPAPVDDEEIDALRRVIRSGLRAEPSPFLRNGDRVRLIGGPLAGLAGVLIRQKRGNRVLVQVTLISQALAVDVESSWVRSLQTADDCCALAAGRAGW